ncbi:MAG TPA: hypothetical protein VMK65_01295 [Longimicrobiales bacterium]|nr:hypothetical protein [Longimicrobiales bacterium]
MRISWLPATLPCLLVLLPVFSTGCADAGARSHAVVRDSAGVSIVESAGPAWGEDEGWRVAAEPSVDIGVVEGDEAYQLHRVSDVDRLSDGTIVVAENTRLRFYDEEGRHLRDVGREGGGPGEFRWIQELQVLPGDTLLVYDGRARRVSILDPQGAVLTTATPRTPDPLRPRSLLGRLDGRFTGVVIVPTEGDAEGFRRDTLLYVTYDDMGALTDTLARGLGQEWFQRTTQTATAGGGVIFNVEEGTIPFGRSLLHALGPKRLVLGQTDGWVLDVRGPDGALQRSLRRTDAPPRPLSPDELDRYVAWRLDNPRPSAQPARLEKTLRELRYPETLPVFRALRLDSEGALWTEDFRFPWEEQPRWSVFDADGQLLGHVETPAGLSVHAIGPDWVLGTWRDELDVEHVRLHRLERR